MRLKHPNVVRSFQVGEARGLNFLVMEYLEGETLDDVLQRRKKLPPNEAVRLIHQALLGLQHIHEQGMIHRDLKPSNLMLVPGVPRGDDTTLKATVKILDIGLGREMFDESQPAAAANTELTAEGVLLGTPDYLAPEQARDPRSIDIRADIYSLGSVLYHALTGQPPFPDKNLLSQMVRHATEAPRPLKEFNPAISDGLQQIVNWMMAKKPDERYPTPERAAQALQVFLVAESEAGRGTGEEPQLRKFLTWLEAGDDQKTVAPAAAPVIPAAFAVPAGLADSAVPAVASPVAASATPVAVKVATPVPSPGGTPAGTVDKGQRSSKRHKHQRRPDAPRSPTNVKSAPPVAAVAAPANVVMDIDVELVNVDASRPAGRGWSLNRRDWILLGIGAGSVILAGVVGMVLAMMFRS